MRATLMTVDDFIPKILQRLQETVARIESQMATKDDVRELAHRLGAVELRLGAVELRLGTVEQVLVANVSETRALTQIVKQHEHRISALEAPK